MSKEADIGAARQFFFELCGRADGREDQDVLSYTIPTESISGCLTPKMPLTVLLGMKGVGKSTAFKRMTAEPPSGFLVAGFAPGSERFKRLSNVQPGLFRERFLALFLIAAISMLEESELLDAKDKSSLSILPAPLESILKTLDSAVKEGRSRLKGGSAFGFGLSFDLSEDQEKKLDQFDRAAARAKLQALAGKGVAVRFFVDDPEQSLPPGEQGSNALVGLILAANEININFRGVVGLTVLLKTHVYQKVSGNEELANMIPAQRGALSWTEDELLAAVESRLTFAGLSYADAFAFKKGDLKKHVISLLRNGPRDLFVWISMASRASGGEKLKLDDFSATKKSIGEFSMQQISAAYTNEIPNIPRLLRLVFPKNKEYSWEALIAEVAELRTNSKEFIELSEKNKLDLSSDYAKFFLEAGTLQLTTKGNVVEPFGKDYHHNQEIGKDTKVRVHPLLAAALF
ncbi:P-loop ATPase, Sll1717 family [Bradyrhizobium sp. UFLA05-112]